MGPGPSVSNMKGDVALGCVENITLTTRFRFD